MGDTELYVILIDVYDIEFIKELRRFVWKLKVINFEYNICV